MPTWVGKQHMRINLVWDKNQTNLHTSLRLVGSGTWQLGALIPKQLQFNYLICYKTAWVRSTCKLPLILLRFHSISFTAHMQVEYKNDPFKIHCNSRLISGGAYILLSAYISTDDKNNPFQDKLIIQISILLRLKRKFHMSLLKCMLYNLIEDNH